MIKVGFCASYDWEMLKRSLPLIYAWADLIVISIDKHRRTWSGGYYQFDEQRFKNWISEVDTQKKITLYEDDFYLPNLNPIENDTRQRNLMANVMGQGGWHLQVDSDEYFLDFEGFFKYLQELNPEPKTTDTPINVNCIWIPIIKKLKRGYLYVPPIGKRIETTPVATNKPEYSAARRNSHFNHISPFYLIHETWARSEDELRRKMESWGHSVDFDKDEYLKKWQSMDEINYHKIRNFHPLKPEVWARLEYLEAADMDEFLLKISPKLQKPNSLRLALQNSRIISKINAILN